MKKVHRPCVGCMIMTESTRLARDGRRYCEKHYWALPDEKRWDGPLTEADKDLYAKLNVPYVEGH